MNKVVEKIIYKCLWVSRGGGEGYGNIYDFPLLPYLIF